MREKTATGKGQLVARILTGSWRYPNDAPLGMSESELDAVTPLLYDSGTAALGWQRVRNTPLGTSSSAEVLHQAYRLQSLQAEIHEEKIEKVFRLFRAAGIEAVLAKGWASAGMYNAKALRPYGDIDLCVRAADVKPALRILGEPAARDCWVDLHGRFVEINDRTVEDLFVRSRNIPLGNETIRILGVEDQLALSCIHMLKHGAWRPLWLCDVAVAIESLPASFNWDVCLGRSATRSNWIGCAIALASRLLDAQTDDVPMRTDNELPEWLVDNVLQQWDRPFAICQPPMSHPIPMAHLIRHPSDWLNGLRQRWPNPIIATISVNGRFNNVPRLPYQMVNCLARIGRLLIGSQNGLSEH
ncbi:MAG TPA: nucleotidyltransferase family protein [Pyrinomonadaceae bacterium]|nr:nucleotidyltransferase family protein [Pyrinomonadaceae bacterium]